MKTFILWISFLFFTMNVAAQTNYYTSDKTFYENGYTYQCDIVEGSKFVTLYNKSNKFTYVNQTNRNTGEIISIEQNRALQLMDDSWTRPKCNSIVNSAFSFAEKQRVKGFKVTVIMYINPDTGKVAEVKFRFASFNPYATIPVSVFRKIETELKNSIWFTPTGEGKKRNYIICGWRHEVK